MYIQTSPVAADYYRATLRVVCMLQHDYPEFLAVNHLVLSSAIPASTVQLFNLIGCANPTAFQDLPDPFQPGLKINRLEQVRQHPNISGDLHGTLVRRFRSSSAYRDHFRTAPVIWRRA